MFALAFGPALIRSLSRFTMRLNVTWQAGAPLLASPSRSPRCSGQSAGGRANAAAGTPAGYLLAAQNADGGFGAAPGSGSSTLYAGWAALGLAAAGENPQDVTRDGHSLIGYVEGGVGSGLTRARSSGTSSSLRAAGLPAASFGGRDLVAELRARHPPERIGVNDQTNLTSFAVLALRAAGVAPPAGHARLAGAPAGRATAASTSRPRGGLSDVDDTGAALEALAGVPGRRRRDVRARAVAYIRAPAGPRRRLPEHARRRLERTVDRVRRSRGCWRPGVDPGSLHRRGAPSPLDYLRSLIAADGHVRYSRADDETPVWVTAEALMALDGRPLPIAAVARRVTAARTARGRSSRRPTHADAAASTPPHESLAAVRQPRRVRLAPRAARADGRRRPAGGRRWGPRPR